MVCPPRARTLGARRVARPCPFPSLPALKDRARFGVGGVRLAGVVTDGLLEVGNRRVVHRVVRLPGHPGAASLSARTARSVATTSAVRRMV